MWALIEQWLAVGAVELARRGSGWGGLQGEWQQLAKGIGACMDCRRQGLLVDRQVTLLFAPYFIPCRSFIGHGKAVLPGKTGANRCAGSKASMKQAVVLHLLMDAGHIASHDHIHHIATTRGAWEWEWEQPCTPKLSQRVL